MSVRFKPALVMLALLAVPVARASDELSANVAELTAWRAQVAAQAPAAVEEAEHEAETKASAELAATLKKTGGYMLKVDPAPTDASAPDANPLLVQLTRQESSAERNVPLSMLLAWTTPSGETTAIPLRHVDGGTWASRIDAGREEGKHRLRLALVIDSPAASAEELIEIEYRLEIPSLDLKIIATRKLQERGGESGPAAHAKPEKAKAGEGPSAIAMAALLAFLNVVLLGLPLCLALMLGKVPPPLREKILSPFAAIGRRLPRSIPKAGKILFDEGILRAAAAGTALAAATALVDSAEPPNLERMEAVDDRSGKRKRAEESVSGNDKTELLIKRLQESDPTLSGSKDDADGLDPVATEGGDDLEALDLDNLNF